MAALLPIRSAQKKTGPGIARTGVSLPCWPLRGRALAPVAAAEAEAAEPGRLQLPGSPIRPGTSASPEAVAEAAAAEAAEAAEAPRSCRSRSP